mmetsp:Transcript_175964/g.564256  ORF Transcript_175964/g.564256 Transcript_175964/m.564256 type:complete len:84 (+) Transcript_175964:3141-3392(+)
MLVESSRSDRCSRRLFCASELSSSLLPTRAKFDRSQPSMRSSGVLILFAEPALMAPRMSSCLCCKERGVFLCFVIKLAQHAGH